MQGMGNFQFFYQIQLWQSENLQLLVTWWACVCACMLRCRAQGEWFRTPFESFMHGCLLAHSGASFVIDVKFLRWNTDKQAILICAILELWLTKWNINDLSTSCWGMQKSPFLYSVDASHILLKLMFSEEQNYLCVTTHSGRQSVDTGHVTVLCWLHLCQIE